MSPALVVALVVGVAVGVMGRASAVWGWAWEWGSASPGALVLLPEPLRRVGVVVSWVVSSVVGLGSGMGSVMRANRLNSCC